MDLSDYLNKVYFFGATLAVGYAALFVAKKGFRMNLGLPSSLETAAKSAAVLGTCALSVDYAQEKKLIPKDPFKDATKTSSS